jgi:hypothetical protein
VSTGVDTAKQVGNRRIGGTTLGALALSHHWPDQHDRCIKVGERHICRRCAVLYPITIAVLLLGLAGVRWPITVDHVLLFLLPFPLVVDYVAEHIGAITYNARRQIITTAIAAPALGTAFVRYVAHESDPLFWQVVGIYAATCFVAFLISQKRAKVAEQTASEEAQAVDPLIQGFEDREAFLAYLAAGERKETSNIAGSRAPRAAH